MFFCIIWRIKAIKIVWLPILALYSCILPEDNLGTDTSAPTAIAQNGHMLYVLTGGADTQIRTINTTTKEVRTVLKTSGTGRNDGRGTTARFNHPSDITFAWNNRTGRFRGWETLYVADTGNHFIREIQLEGTNMANFPNVLRMVGSSGAKGGYNDGRKLKSRFDSPQGIAASPDGKMLYIADTANHSIRTVARETIMLNYRVVKLGRQVDTLAGGRTPGEHGKGIAGYMDAVGADARFNGPTRVAVSPDGKTLYVADTGNNRIRSIEIASGTVSTLAGDGSKAQFDQPQGIAASPDGTTLYVCDTGNNRIRSIEIASGKVETLAGDGTAAQFNQPQGIAVIGNTIYVADTGNNRILSIENGKVETLAGDGT